MSSAVNKVVPQLKNVTRLLTTLMGSGGKKKVDPKSLTPMYYPYTRTAQWIQTDWVHLWKNAWMYRYMSYAWLTTVPLWLWIDSKVNSPEAKLAWKKKKELDHKKEHLKEWEVL